MIYALYTPVIGFLFGLSVFAVGMGVIAYSKKLLPEDLTIQQRHDGRSQEVDRRTAAARLVQTGQQSGITRRKLVYRSIGAAGGVLGLGVARRRLRRARQEPVEGGAQTRPCSSPGGTPRTASGSTCDATPASPRRSCSCAPATSPRARSRRSTRSRSPSASTRRSSPRSSSSPDSPVMLIHLRPDVTVIKRAGQEDFNYGALFAYSKICSHMGCPTSLYEDQTKPHPLPLPPVAVPGQRVRQARLRPGRPVHWRNCPSRWTIRDTCTRAATSSNRWVRRSGSGSS